MQNRKQVARKSEVTSVLAGEPRHAVELCSDEHAVALRDSFDGWLNSLEATFQPNPSESDAPGSPKALTSRDVREVNRATIRESFMPRLWPPDVVLSFLAADVIKRK